MSTCAALVRSMLTLRKERRSGVLAVQAEVGKTFVYLDQGTPVFAEEGTHGETLGRLLVRQGKLTQDQYREVIAKMTDALVINEQLRFGEVAVELGYLTEAQVSKALGDQVRWKIVRVLQRRETSWEFEESLARLEDIPRLPMGIESLVLDAARWVDDEDKLELGLGQALDRRMKVEAAIVPLVVGSFELNADEEGFLAVLDGERTLRDALERPEAAYVDAAAIATALLLTRALLPVAAPAPRTPDRPFVPVRMVASSSTSTSTEVPPAGPTFAPPAPPPRAPVASPQPRVPPAAPAAAPAAPSPSPSPSPSPPGARAGVPVAPGSDPAKRVVRPHMTRASTILKALEAQRVKAEPQRTPTSEHEAKLLGERVFQTGLDQLRAGRYAAAAAAFDQAVKLFPQADEYRLYAKWCGIRARGELAHALERQELKRLASATVKADPNFAFGHVVLGEIARDEDDTAQAHRLLLRATKLDPSLLEAQRLLRIIERALEPTKKKLSIRRSED